MTNALPDDLRSGGATADAIRHHYDVSSAFYRLWLDNSMTYTSARWVRAATLEEAQRAKLDFFLDRICRDGARDLLDVGCGWGSMLRRSLERGAVQSATGLTLSQDQHDTACATLPSAAQMLLEDWEGFVPDRRFGAMACLGAIEHFARSEADTAARRARYRLFFEAAHEWLERRGRLGLQSIILDESLGNSGGPLAEFFQTEIFPESALPRLADLLSAASPWFRVVELESRPDDYAKTCQAWRANLLANRSTATAVAGIDVVQRYDTYLGAARMCFRRRDWSLARIIFEARPRPLRAEDLASS